MPIIKDGVVVSDSFSVVRDTGADLPEGDLIVSLAVWRDQRAGLEARNTKLGVLLASDEPPMEIADDLNRFSVIALEFPAYRDGRAYSYARLLRDRYGYKGEVRAVGDVLRDQYFYMDRCGFDAVDVKDADEIENWRAAMAEVSVTYQRASDARLAAYQSRGAAVQTPANASDAA